MKRSPSNRGPGVLPVERVGVAASAGEPLRRPTTFVVCLGLAALAALHGALAWDVAREKTPTLDEIAHLPAGLSYLDQRSFRMYRLSPPLARILPAYAVARDGLRLHYGAAWKANPPSHWAFAFAFLLIHSDHPDLQQRYLHAFTKARLVVVAWSMATIPFLFLWGQWWFGPWAGWLAAALWALCPNLIAHASMVTTDLAATSIGLIASYAFARWLERRTWGRALVAGSALGVAQLVKFSSLWLYPLWMAWGVASFLYRRARGTADRLSIYICQLSAQVILSVVVINAGYLFHGTGTPLERFPFVCNALTRPRTSVDGPADLGSNLTYNRIHQERVNRFRGSWLGRIPCPLPYDFVAGFDEQKFEADGKYQMYLRGELRRQGWWYYYLYTLVIKVPPSTWVVVLAGALVLLQRGMSHRLGPLAGLALVPIAVMSLLTDINLGLRYVLPSLPYFFLIAGGCLATPPRRAWRVLAAVALAYNISALWRIHPHELAYFNELVGGPKQGRFHLIDSNLDWGQDLRGLARWLERHPDWQRDIRIAYLGTVPPEFEGIRDYRLAPRDLRQVPPEQWLPSERLDDPWSYGPQPGRFAISVNFERGMQFHSPLPFSMLEEQGFEALRRALLPGTQMLWNPAGTYAYFQHFEPRIEPEIGYSILLYEISLEQANAVRRLLGMPELKEKAGASAAAPTSKDVP